MKTKQLTRVRFVECCLCGHEVSTHTFEAVDNFRNKLIGLCCDACAELDDQTVWDIQRIGKGLHEEDARTLND